MSNEDTGASSAARLLEVVVDRIAPAMSERVDLDVRLACQLFSTLHASIIPNVPTDVRVVVAADFDSAARALYAVRGTELSPPYSAQREFGRAVGKLFSEERDGRIAATVLVDVGLWLAENGSELSRLVGLLHEFGHLLYQCIRVATGEPSAPPPGERTFEQGFVALAETLWEEYQVDVLVIRRVAQVPSLTHDRDRFILVAVALRAGYDQAVCDALDILCTWVRTRVQRYRETWVGLTEIWQEGAPRLEQMFTLLAHALGHFSAIDSTAELRTLLHRSPGFATFLEEDWTELLAAFQEPRIDAVPRIREAFLRTMHRLGFSAEMTGQGLYVHVHEPRFCET